ncbi:DUF6160 family protein [Metapseudomonas otitidis]|uniref:DUF6160 domain-containing protein n=1 Tax=Metapseudomonas otitidis TaxID=319939 RepID=A0A679GUI9_9GAMM|nr:DUF6160 family protein [Pseudomonas otitidis]BCA30820.1 hypothetical protein PtoMrB4_47970 [Pseudomonas otitidis]
MRPSRSPFRGAVFLLAASLLATAAQAQMQALDDAELSTITGQAFINLTTDANAGINYTRVNFGVDVDTQLNIKKLQLGQYDRAGEAAGSSDILINNFALGTVNADNTINPFKVSNPFVEFAYSGNQVVGVRIGFGEAKGVLSGDIQSLTGNIPVHISGNAKPIRDAASGIDRFLLGAAGIRDETKLEADATLVNSSGNADPVRGTMAGLTNGTALNCVSGCTWGGLSDGLLSLFKSSGCGILSLTTCFNLSQFQSLPVGNTSNMAGMDGAAKGFFISLQTQDVAWRDMDSNAFMTALKGAFMNMPKYRDANGNMVSPINIDFEQAFNGIPRQDTCLGSATKGC